MTDYRGEPGKAYRPSNGTEGDMFRDYFCDRCEKDSYRDEWGMGGCSILCATMGYGIGDPDYPREWVYGPDGLPTCTAFREEK